MKKWYPWMVVAMLWGVAMLNYLDRQMLSTMRPSIMTDIADLQKAENFGRLMAIFLWIYGLMSPAAGLIADRINRKWLIAGSLFVWSGVTLCMGFATTFGQLYILRATMGVSEALYIPAALSLIADYHVDRTRSLAVGIHMTGIYAGQALGGFGASIAGALSWQSAFSIFGAAGLVYSLFLVVFLKEKRVNETSGHIGVNMSQMARSVGKTLGMLLGMTSFWIILFYFAVPSFPGWATKNWLPTLFSGTLGIDMTMAGPLSTITIAVSSFAGVITGGLLADRWISYNLRGRIYTGAAGLLLTIPALLLTCFGNTAPLIIAGGFLFGFGFGMFDANNMPILCQFVPPRQRAAAYGLMNLTGVFAGALVTSWLGKSTDAGNLGRDMALLAIPVAVAVILLLTFLRPSTGDMKDAS